MAARMAAMSFSTEEAVSTCTTRIALISCAVSALRRLSTASGSTARRGRPFSTSTSSPSRAACAPHETAKTPLSSTSTLSPRESVLVSAISHAPCPLAAATKGVPEVRATAGSFASIASEVSTRSPS